MSGEHKETPEATRAQAKKRKQHIVEPAQDELFVDIDSLEALDKFSRCIEIVQRLSGPLGISIKPSRTEGHFHVTVKWVKPIRHIERVFLQALLGSDPVRECLSLEKIHHGHTFPVCFFE